MAHVPTGTTKELQLLTFQDALTAAKIAANYTMACIRATAEEENHWYGAKFEPVLGQLIRLLED